MDVSPPKFSCGSTLNPVTGIAFNFWYTQVGLTSFNITIVSVGDQPRDIDPGVAASEDVRTERKLVRILAERGWTSRRHLHQGLSGRVTAERFHRILAGLLDYKK